MNTSINTTTSIAPMSVPTDYAALGVVGGYAPPNPTALRLFIIGPSGDGKTSFLAGMPRTLILDFEGGAWGVPQPRAHRIVCKTVDKFKAIHEKLIADAKAGRRKYDRIGFDTIDQLAEILNPDLASAYGCTDITQYGSHGAGWAILKNALWGYISSLEKEGYTWAVLGHMTEKTITVNNKEKTVIRPVLSDSIAKHISRNSDYFVTIHSRMETIPQYRDVMLPGGKTQRIEAGVKETPVYLMKASAVGSLLGTNQNKQRGVPTMPQEVILPDLMSGQYGWDTFASTFSRCVAEVKELTAPAPAVTPDPKVTPQPVAGGA